MIGTESEDEISLFALATELLSNRWRIFRWMLVGGVIAALVVSTRSPQFEATASFVPEGNDPSRSGLAGLAGQFGVAIPTGNLSQSPEFYTGLLESQVLLAPITRDTFLVSELGGRRIPFTELFEITTESAKLREERGVTVLVGLITTSSTKSTGVVELAVATQWPSVSLAIATALFHGINEYNQQTRRSRAAAERRFLEARLAVASSDLRGAESQMERFLVGNRQLGSSPELMFARDRLQRDVTAKQQVLNSLSQAYEDARIREVRDTPVISIVQPPSVAATPKPRQRLRWGLIGILGGGFLGVLLTLLSAAIARRREQGDPETERFIETLGTVRREILARLMGLIGRARELQ